jgi:hypothetical protein
MITVNGIDYPPDPMNPGWALGWAVFRRSPWHFVQLAATRHDAIAQAREMGAGYEAAFGSHLPGTDKFSVHGGMASGTR